MKLLDNIWLKIFALLVGLVLWFHVATEKVYQYRVKLPVAGIVLGENLTLSEPGPDSIKVAVSARGKQLLRTRWRNRGVKIHAADLAPGRHTLSLSPANLSLVAGDKDITLDEVISPTTCELVVDYTSENRVNVRPDLVVTADDGFVVRSISAPRPPQATLIGARSKVRQVASVSTEPRRLSHLRDNLTLKLALRPIDDAVIRIEPESVTVSIEIVAVKTRVFDSVHVIVRNAPVGSSLTVEPDRVTVELTGPPEIIDALDPGGLVASVDYLIQDSLGYGPLEFDVPGAVSVKSSSATVARIVED